MKSDPVLIFEPDHGGHRLTFVRLLASALLDIDVRVLVATTERATKSAAFREQLGPLLDRIEVWPDFPAPPQSPLGAAHAKAKGFIDAVTRSRATHAYVPYADGLSQMLAVSSLNRGRLGNGVQSEGLMLRGRFAYPSTGFRGWFASRASLAALRLAPWEVIHHLDPLAYRRVLEGGGELATRSRLMPDPVEASTLTRHQARQHLRIPKDGRYVVCVGALDERKGADLLVEAFASSERRADDRLLLVGQLSPGVRRQVERHGLLSGAGIGIVIDRYVSDDDLRAAVSAADLVCTPYPRHIGSASIVIRAAAAGRPVLASSFGWMGYVINRFGLGSTVQGGDIAALRSRLPVALAAASEYKPGEAARRFVEFHSVENFGRAWTERLRHRLSLPPQPVTPSWNEVEAAAERS